MPCKRLNRGQVQMKPLAERENRQNIEIDAVMPDQMPKKMNESAAKIIEETAERIGRAMADKKPVMLAFGAHTIKNGLAPVLNHFLENGWVTHLATNGAGVIHDWEYAYLGKTSEYVAANVADGTFGNWYETGFYLNLALVIGAYEGLGYGEAVGKMISTQGLDIPDPQRLADDAAAMIEDAPEQAAAALDLLATIRRFDLQAGRMDIPHPFKKYSVQAKAYDLGVPFTSHPMFGHDIIYNHPLNHGAAIGRAAQRDFLTFAEGVSRIDGGVYLSIGSAVMSPMIFEKSMSMAQNIALQQGRRIENHFIVVVDLAASTWDWSQGEPPEDSPDYYLRYNKSFSRMGGNMRYLQADNRDFLLAVGQRLNQ